MITYIEKGIWMHEAIADAGYSLAQVDGVWVSSDDVAVQSIIDSFDPLPYAKAEKIVAIKTEAAKRGKDIYSFLSANPEHAIDFYQFGSDIIDVIAPGSRQGLPANIANFKAIRDVAAAAIATINDMTDWTAVMTYNVVNTPAWP